jgi:hypothetical protein
VDTLTTDFYDFSFQSPTSAPSWTLAPGDSLEVDCAYSTSDATTTFGLGSNNEMCMTFLQYYPAQDLSSCGGSDQLLVAKHAWWK